MKARVIHEFSPEEERYIYPAVTVIDKEDASFSIGTVGFQTLFTLKYRGYIYKAGKKWQLVASGESENNHELYRTVRLVSYNIRVCDKSELFISEEIFDYLRDMLFAFASRYDPRGMRIKAHCAICGLPLDEFYSHYPNPVCRDCDQKAVNNDRKPPKFNSAYDSGDNPIFIDGKKCWRRYKFGGYITMLDSKDCQNLAEFYERHRDSAVL